MKKKSQLNKARRPEREREESEDLSDVLGSLCHNIEKSSETRDIFFSTNISFPTYRKFINSCSSKQKIEFICNFVKKKSLSFLRWIINLFYDPNFAIINLPKKLKQLFQMRIQITSSSTKRPSHVLRMRRSRVNKNLQHSHVCKQIKWIISFW